nr:MAG TPA: hypothetical protein [Caudoviricetes sp.]
MSLKCKKRGTYRIFYRNVRGTKLGTEYSLSPKEEYLGNVPEGPWVHEQEQGGYASAPCNPVTMSPDMD